MSIDLLNGTSQIFPTQSSEAFFAAAPVGGDTTPAVAQATIAASQRQINRLRGYKIELSPANNAQLLKIQEEIQNIERKAAAGTVRNDELEDRLELFKDADRILGKPTVDIEGDETLAQLSAGLDLIVKPNLPRAIQQRVDSLVRIKNTLEERLFKSPDSGTLKQQFQAVSGLIQELTPPRAIESLSAAERREYDEQVELINAYAGAKVELQTDELIKVNKLQRTIGTMQRFL